MSHRDRLLHRLLPASPQGAHRWPSGTKRSSNSTISTWPPTRSLDCSKASMSSTPSRPSRRALELRGRLRLVSPQQGPRHPAPPREAAGKALGALVYASSSVYGQDVETVVELRAVHHGLIWRRSGSLSPPLGRSVGRELGAPARSFASSRWPRTRRKLRSASSMPAAVQRSTISPPRQSLHFALALPAGREHGTRSDPWSEACARAESGPKPRRVMVSVSSRPSRRLAAPRGAWARVRGPAR
jgi:hypothetical protein